MTLPFRPAPVRPPLAWEPVGRAREASNPFLRGFLPSPADDKAGAQMVAESLPVVGDILGALRGLKAARKGKFGEAAIEALFAALPFFSVPAAMKKNVQSLASMSDEDVLRVGKTAFSRAAYDGMVRNNPTSASAALIRRQLELTYQNSPVRLAEILSGFFKPRTTHRIESVYREPRPAHVADVIDNLRSVGLDDEARNLEAFIAPSKVKEVVAHGTKSPVPFDIFRVTPEEAGIHVGTLGQAHAINKGYGASATHSILPLAMRAENPIKVSRDPGTGWTTSLAFDQLKHVLSDTDRSWVREALDYGRPDEAQRQLKEALLRRGIDAVEYRNIYENPIKNKLGNSVGRRSFIVFDPSQLKSLLGNAGTFDPSNPSMIR